MLKLRPSESENFSVESDSLWHYGLYSLWTSLDQNIGVYSLSLLQGIFPTQGSNPCLPHCRQGLYFLPRPARPSAATSNLSSLHPPPYLQASATHSYFSSQTLQAVHSAQGTFPLVLGVSFWVSFWTLSYFLKRLSQIILNWLSAPSPSTVSLYFYNLFIFYIAHITICNWLSW